MHLLEDKNFVSCSYGCTLHLTEAKSTARPLFAWWGTSYVYIIRMTSKEVIRRLWRDGWMLRNVTGSHQHFVHSTKPGVVTVPFTNRDIPIGTLRSIFRQAGWDWRTRR